MEELTLATLFTAGGYVGAAVLVRYFVQLLKAAFPTLSERVSGALQAFVAAAALYVLAFVAVGPFTPDGVFGAFLGWLIVAGGAVGVDSTINHVTGATAKAIGAKTQAAYDLGFERASLPDAAPSFTYNIAAPDGTITTALPSLDGTAPGGTNG